VGVFAQKTITVKTTDGPVMGIQLDYWKEFKGIPFAQPPVNDLRFAPPHRVIARTVPYDATKYKNVCYQGTSPEDYNPIGSEDCLYLNVFVPNTVTDSAAVMIWIHGGFYAFGGGQLYSGEFLSNGTNTIIVTISYRLGAFGFLALKELLARDNTTGNYAYLDQRMAIEWVYNNIQYFGGNPKLITIAGESAGAHSTCVHLGSATQNYYRGAIIESTYVDCGCRSLESAVSDGQALASKFGCQGTGPSFLRCVMNVSSHQIQQSYNGIAGVQGLYFRPCIDGNALTDQPFVNIAKHLKVPLLLGTNVNEDQTFHCTTEHLADLVSPVQDVYFYRFDYPPALHASELEYLWHHQNLKSSETKQLSTNMKNYWMSFVENQIPKSPAQMWPRYTTPSREFLELNVTLSVGTNFKC